MTFDGMGRPKKGAEKMEWAQAAAAALPIQSTPGVVPIHGGPAWTGSRAERAATCLEAGKTQFRRMNIISCGGGSTLRMEVQIAGRRNRKSKAFWIK